MPIFNWDVTKPAGTDPISAGDDQIRADKDTLRKVLGTLTPYGVTTTGWRAVQVNDETWLTQNASYDGTNWNRDDTTKGAAALRVGTSGNWDYFTAPAGANPITWTVELTIAPSTTVSANPFLPAQDAQTDLGTSSQRWRDVYVANSIKVGGVSRTTLSSAKRVMVLAVPGSPGVGAIVSGRVIAPVPGTITAVRSTCRAAPSSGTYTYDINKNGSTIYTTQSNRPTRTTTDSISAKTHALPDVTSFVAGDVFDVDLDAAGSGIQDVLFFIEFNEG